MGNKELNFDWSTPYSKDDEPTLPADTLQRSQYAEVLTRYLQERSKDRSYVLNINSQWGSGKTYFIKRWVETLRANFDVVYVDAWKYDYSDDPLLTVISEIRKQVPRLTETLSKLKVIGAMAKAGLPSLVSGLVKKFSGFDSGVVEAEVEAELLASSAAKVTEILLQSFEQQSEAISSFKRYLRELKPEKCKDKPFFIFIDELDRCRPTYAIELLETVKHLFDVPEYVFVIATDTEQLAHSICAIYGQKFDAGRYLSRFFDDSYKLPVRDIQPFIESIGLPELLNKTKELVSPAFDQEGIVNAVSALFKHFEVSLRDVEKIVARFQLFVLEVGHKQKSFDPLFTLLALISARSGAALTNKLFNQDKVFYSSGMLDELDKIKVVVYEEEQRTCKTNIQSLLQDRQSVLNGNMTQQSTRKELNSYGGKGEKYPPKDHEIYRHIAVVYEPPNRKHLTIEEYQELLNNAVLLG